MNHTVSRSIRILALVVIVATCIGVVPALAAGDVWIVNPALADESLCTASGRRCKTIQAAITAAASGDIIDVSPGTYVENLLINKPLTLAGAGQSVTTILPALSAPNPCSGASLCTGASYAILVQASNVTIHDLTLDGDNPALISGLVRGGADLDARNGIITDHTLGPIFDNLEVYRVTIKNIYLRGMYASTGGSFNFHHNTVQNVQGEANSIAMFAWSAPGTMAFNTVSYANDAISANHSRGIQFLNNIVTHSSSGIHTDNAGDGGGTADLIQGNTISECAPDGYGIWVFVPHIAPTFRANTVLGCAVGMSAWGGVGATPVTPLFVNNFIDAQHLAGSTGAYVTTDQVGYGDGNNSVAFSGNTIVNNEVGIAFQQKGGMVITPIFHMNQISGNTWTVDNSNAANVDATNNWWGSPSGPVVSTFTGTVTYTPFSQALIANTTASTHEIGEIATLNTFVSANNLYGAQLRLTYDDSILVFQAPPASSHNDAGGFFWDYVAEDFIAVSGPIGLRLSGSMSGGSGHPTGVNVTGANLATWQFRCAAAGTSSLTYDTTAGGLGTKLSILDGFEIPAALTGDSITCVAATASVTGTIELQGRLQGGTYPTGWNDAVVTLTCANSSCAGSGPYTFVTGVNGTYQLTKAGPGTGITQGTYSASVSRRGYLGASRTGVVVGTGTATLSTPKLLGGDVTADGRIEIGDMTLIGGAFGTSAVPADTGADVNGDGVVNIFDLVMAGGNYGLTASPW